MSFCAWVSAIAVLLTSFTSFAAEEVAISRAQRCSAVDLRAHFGPVWDQQNTGFCYAAAVSDFLGFYTGQVVSAPDIAVINIELATPFEKAIRKIILGGDWSQGALPGTTMDRLSRVGLCKFTGFIQKEGVTLDFNEVNQRLLRDEISHTETCAPGQRSKRFQIDYDIQGPGLADGSSDDVLPAVDGELDKNRPALMVYDVGYALPGTVHGAHVSNIVGRRWNTKNSQCEYLIRNSWGASFGENGYAWTSGDRIEKAADSIYSLNSIKTK